MSFNYEIQVVRVVEQPKATGYHDKTILARTIAGFDKFGDASDFYYHNSAQIREEYEDFNVRVCIVDYTIEQVNYTVLETVNNPESFLEY